MHRNYALLSKNNIVVGTLNLDDRNKGIKPIHVPFIEIGEAKVQIGMIYNQDENTFFEQPKNAEPTPETPKKRFWWFKK